MPIEDSIILITSVDTENRKFGTGFVFHVDGEVDYVMTCRHVAADVAAETQGAVCINYHEYPLLEIFMNTADDPDDMAVLKIRGPLEMAPLPIRPVGRPGLKIRAFGYYRYSTTPDNHRQLPVDGELGERGILNFRSRKGRLVTWDIEIEGRRTLHDGYSGSPVIYEGHVIGIVSHKLQKGEVGVAVSIDALGHLLPDVAVRLLKKEDTDVFEGFRETNVEISKNKVFICYAREDEDTARRLYKDLQKAGMAPWMDKQDLIPGQNWKFILNQAIKGSDYFIALLSSHSVSKRGYVQKEFNYALDVLDGMPPDEIFVIPVRLEDCEVPYEKVKDIQWVDLFVDYDGGLKSILRAFGQTAGAEIVEKTVVDTPTRESEEPLPGPSTVLVNDAGQGKVLSIDSLGMEFVCIPAGEFMMGQNEQEKEELIKQVGLDKYKRYYQDELPRHRVTIEKAFYMQATMVTQGQWKAVMSGNPSHFKNCGDDCPVESVSWEDAQAFIRKLNEMEGTGGIVCRAKPNGSMRQEPGPIPLFTMDQSKLSAPTMRRPWMKLPGMAATVAWNMMADMTVRVGRRNNMKARDVVQNQ